MWIDDDFIVPEHVVAVVPYGQKKHRDGTVTSKGCEIWLLSGGVLSSKRPTTQVVSMLGLVRAK